MKVLCEYTSTKLRGIETDLEVHKGAQKKNIQQKVDDVKYIIDKEVKIMSARLERLENKVENVLKRFHFDTETTVIAIGLNTSPGEDILHKANDLITRGLNIHDVPVVQGKRLTSKTNKPGLVKIEFNSLYEKKRVLRAKAKLKNSTTYGKVFLRSSKTHCEQILEHNLQVVLESSPIGTHYRKSGNG